MICGRAENGAGKKRELPKKLPFFAGASDCPVQALGSGSESVGPITPPAQCAQTAGGLLSETGGAVSSAAGSET